MNYSREQLPMVGIIGETKPPDYLVDYGIQNEGSDMRAHVCVLAQKVYVYRTSDGVKLIQSGKYTGKPASQSGYNGATAWGYPIPIKDIPHVPVSAIRLIDMMKFDERENTTVKGQKAVVVVARLLKIGWFPLPVNPKIVESADMQINGLDIEVRSHVRIQVKCDYKGGIGQGCTGNLYLQTAEINPFKRV